MTVLLSLNAQRSGRVWFMLTCPTSITEIGISLNLMKRMTLPIELYVRLSIGLK